MLIYIVPRAKHISVQSFGTTTNLQKKGFHGRRTRAVFTTKGNNLLWLFCNREVILKLGDIYSLNI
jgi:hypothetical protein